MPPLRHPSHPHSVILRNPTPSPYTSPFRHPPPPIPSSSAKAGDPVRECAFLPRSGHNTHITAIVQSHPRQGANAPLGSRLRGSDEGWGHSTSIQPSTMPPLRPPQYLHCVILRNPTPSSSAPYSVILRTRTPSSSPPTPSSSAKAEDPVRTVADYFSCCTEHRCKTQTSLPSCYDSTAIKKSYCCAQPVQITKMIPR